MISNIIHLIIRHWLSLTVLNLLIITVLSLTPLKELPSVPGTDKIHHFIAYSALMFPVALRRPYKWIFLGIAFILYSGVIELLQPYVNRHADWMDMAANTLGIIIGMILSIFIRLYSISSHQ